MTLDHNATLRQADPTVARLIDAELRRQQRTNWPGSVGSGWPVERAKKKAGEIYETLLRIFDMAKRDKIPTYEAADRLAQQRIAAVGSLDRMWVGKREGRE